MHMFPIAGTCDKILSKVNYKTDREKEIEAEPKSADDIKSN